MLPKHQRITRTEFATVMKSSKLFSIPIGSVRYTKVSPIPNKQFLASVVVAKKTIKSSVLRHRAKRRVYSALETLCKSQNPPSGAYIIFPRLDVLSLPFTALVDQLKSVLVKENSS